MLALLLAILSMLLSVFVLGLELLAVLMESELVQPVVLQLL